MVYRIYVEKKPGFDGEAQSLRNELVSLLGIKELSGLRLLNRYDVEGIDEALFEQCVPTVFSEPPVDNTYAELPAADGCVSFAVEYLPGQFDQRADSAAECIQLISQGERPLVRSARVYLLEGTLTDEQLAEIKKYVINPVEAREASLDTKQTLKMEYPVPAPVKVLEGFNQLDEEQLKKFIADNGLAMDLGDIEFCQKYFRSEHRDPTITEIRVVDTYWSDHCRHTTFSTHIDQVEIHDAAIQAAYERYLAARVEVYGEEKAAAEIGVGVPTLRDIVSELLKPGRDVRDELPKPILRTDVLEMKDLKPGMVLTGTVRNVIDFGVFVDIGVHQDGLVHISQVSNKFIKHPSEVVSVGDVVKVVVLEVDEKKKRISLSMKQAK